MTDEPKAPDMGVFDKMRDFARKAIEETWPAGVFTLTTLRDANYELAKKVFEDAVIGSARSVLKGIATEETERLFEELASRLRQDPVANLFYEVEVIVASRLVYYLWEANAEDYMIWHMQFPLRDSRGFLTPSGYHHLREVAVDVASLIGKLTAVRERRIQVLLAAAVVGQEAFDKTVAKFGDYQRGVVLHSALSWLDLQSIEDEETRKTVAERVASGTDEQILRLQQHLIGSAFLGKEYVEHLIDEIFTGTEHHIF